jgi:hypothetical protein
MRAAFEPLLPIRTRVAVAGAPGVVKGVNGPATAEKSPIAHALVAATWK